MNAHLLIPGLLLFTFLIGGVAAQVQKPGPSSSDALFDPSRVIQIEIRLDPKDWHALRISHPIFSEDGNQVIARGYEYYRGEVVIDGQVVKSVGVRKKGTGSENTVRPAFKIKFDEYVNGQEFSGLEMLTLNTSPYERTKAMQALAYSFMNRAGVISPRSNLARLVVNGEDLGVYCHVESIDKRFIKRHFGNAKGDLYEGQYRADFTTNTWKKIEHKWGQDDDLMHVRKLMEVLESPGPVSLKSIDEQVDLNAFITFWAATVVVGQGDGYPHNANNYYLYRDAKSGKLFFIPWGADIAFGYGPAGKPEPTSVGAGGFLCWRLWKLAEIRERYRSEMRRLLAEAWNEKTMLEELEQLRRLRELIEPERMATPWLGMTGAEALANLARRIENRRKEVQIELDSPARDWPLPRLEPFTEPPVDTNNPPMLVEGSFSAMIREAFPTNATSYLGQGAATLQFTAAGEIRKPFAQSGAVAVMRKELEYENTIKIVVADAAGDLRWQITFRMAPYRAPLVPGTLEMGGWVGASVLAPISQSQGDPGSRKTQSRSGPENKGTLELTQVSTNLGGTISGKFKINTTAFGDD
jgi:spore coat protein CotH